jgi:hypothetical protein
MAYLSHVSFIQLFVCLFYAGKRDSSAIPPFLEEMSYSCRGLPQPHTHLSHHKIPDHREVSPTHLLFPLLLLLIFAYIEMTNPAPFRSKFNPQIPANLIDYNMVASLLASGADFACKNYESDASSLNPSAAYNAGNTYTMTIDGSTPHMDGSRQLSLSHDGGDTFKVIESIIGGCLLKLD